MGGGAEKFTSIVMIRGRGNFGFRMLVRYSSACFEFLGGTTRVLALSTLELRCAFSW